MVCDVDDYLALLNRFLCIELLDSYLNGPRTLSSTRLSYLIVSQPEPEETTENGSNSSDASQTDADSEYNLLLCATHFLGDGMALHTCANELFSLLSSSDTRGLQDILSFEWQERCYRRIPVRGVEP